MVLKVYNTASRKKEVFKPQEEVVRMYCCGPTVYNFAHIGNLRTFLFEDFLRRILTYNDFEVKHVMNVTDVGHLTDDGDEGEDKMEKGALRENKTVWEIADFYTNAFFEDTKKLNIIKPDVVAKATDHIQDIIDMIKKLEEKGFTYVSEGNVYFDISKFTYYSDLGKLNLDDMRATERARHEGKRNAQDFVLWFTNSKFKNQTMQWDSPWGRGYPGWHIECSAMATKYLGDSFDIHCGGVDHIQVHHTNEIAQSECSCGNHPWVHYWLHGEFLVIPEGKMSKSTGSFITLQTLEDQGYDPVLYRFFCIGTHYRQKLMFSWDALDNAKTAFESLKRKILAIKKDCDTAHIESSKHTIPEDISQEASDVYVHFKKKFLDAINDDLNVTQALGIVHEVIKSDLDSGLQYALLLDFDTVFGLDIKGMKEDEVSVPEDVLSLVSERESARVEKNWEKADALRDTIQQKGFKIKDTPEGPEVSPL